jgi:hypothetical protein
MKTHIRRTQNIVPQCSKLSRSEVYKEEKSSVTFPWRAVLFSSVRGWAFYIMPSLLCLQYSRLLLTLYLETARNLTVGAIFSTMQLLRKRCTSALRSINRQSTITYFFTCCVRCDLLCGWASRVLRAIRRQESCMSAKEMKSDKTIGYHAWRGNWWTTRCPVLRRNSCFIWRESWTMDTKVKMFLASYMGRSWHQ